jgi:methylated-DNA-protein-cysteine methyltransferase-like protein
MPETVSWWVGFYKVVRRIPPGRVCTYGVVAALAGRPRAARHVGYALAALKDGGPYADVPWHRVLGKRPRNRAAVTLKDPVGGAVQRGMLEKERVVFDARGNIDLGRFGWAGAPARRAKVATPKRRSSLANGRQRREG